MHGDIIVLTTDKNFYKEMIDDLDENEVFERFQNDVDYVQSFPCSTEKQEIKFFLDYVKEKCGLDVNYKEKSFIFNVDKFVAHLEGMEHDSALDVVGILEYVKYEFPILIIERTRSLSIFNWLATESFYKKKFNRTEDVKFYVVKAFDFHF